MTINQDISAERDVIPQQNPSSIELSSVEEGILTVLNGNELYGLQIATAFEESSKGAKKINVGTLYPILARLEKQGLVTSYVRDGATLAKGGARRKYFKITETGSFALAEARRFRNELYQWKPAYGEAVFA